MTPAKIISPARTLPAPDVGLFSTKYGIRTVVSPTRVQILSLLSKTELPFDEIVKKMDKAKSTVSIHLRGLEQAGIIGGKTDPNDSRRKIFFFRSQFIGGLATKKPVICDDNNEFLTRQVSDTDPFRFYRLMFRTIRVSLLTEGINIDPVLRKAGCDVGERVYPVISAPDLASFLKKTAKFWKTNSLGLIKIESMAPLVLVVYDCFECGSLPQLGRPACAFDSGILEAVFSRHFKKRQQVTETACFAMGDDHCRFVIVPA
ncbi:V4R domain-containing protein [uncultured Methanoregula sp.]|uniref:V4R domain-containing protein n=1 Tax=uncultured Methanoregula sp. TaxID=1005933 RepID=UPI002AABB737|nr:V4R domain-containing protein [uncultured Methanoregula sp.]